MTSLLQRRWVRVVIIMLASIAVVIGGAFVAVRVVLARPLPEEGVIGGLDGLEDSVRIYREEDGVPHIVAATRDDAYFAQGFVHAQDRFFQMDFYRRMVEGRLAELLGEEAVESDIFMRTLGLTLVAVEEYTTLPEPTRNALERYSAGVNAYLERRDLKPARISVEYLLLTLSGIDVQLDTWTPEDSLSWLKVMSSELSAGLHTQLQRLDLIRAVGTASAADFYVPYDYDSMPTIMNSAGVVGGGALPSGGNGSNSWVVSGEHTARGLPILANDPHLAVQIPSTWYENSLHYRSSNGSSVSVRGFSLAGVPGVVIGHNSRIAWGITDAVVDEQDLYAERINPEDPDQYLSDVGWREMTKRDEMVLVRGRAALGDTNRDLASMDGSAARWDDGCAAGSQPGA